MPLVTLRRDVDVPELETLAFKPIDEDEVCSSFDVIIDPV
jgi:hypothetical protein